MAATKVTGSTSGQSVADDQARASPSGLPSSNRDHDDGKTRARVNMACNHCRGRKIRCDGMLPQCSNCAHLGRPCTYQPVPAEENEANRERKRKNKQRKLDEEFNSSAEYGDVSANSSADSIRPRLTQSGSTSRLSSPSSTIEAGSSHLKPPTSSQAFKATLAQRRARGAAVMTSLESGPSLRRHAPYSARSRPPINTSSSSGAGSAAGALASSGSETLASPASPSLGYSSQSFQTAFGSNQTSLSSQSLGPQYGGETAFRWQGDGSSGIAPAAIMSLRRRSSFDSSGVLELMYSGSSMQPPPLTSTQLQQNQQHYYPPPQVPGFYSSVPPPLSDHTSNIVPRPDIWGHLPHPNMTLHLDVAGSLSSAVPQGAEPSAGSGWLPNRVDDRNRADARMYLRAGEQHSVMRSTSEPGTAITARSQDGTGSIVPPLHPHHYSHGVSLPASVQASERGSPVLGAVRDAYPFCGPNLLDQSLHALQQSQNLGFGHPPPQHQQHQQHQQSGAMSMGSMSPNSSRDSANDGVGRSLDGSGLVSIGYGLSASSSAAAMLSGGSGFLPANYPSDGSQPLNVMLLGPPNDPYHSASQAQSQLYRPSPGAPFEPTAAAATQPQQLRLDQSALHTGFAWNPAAGSNPASPESHLGRNMYDMQLTDTSPSAAMSSQSHHSASRATSAIPEELPYVTSLQYIDARAYFQGSSVGTGSAGAGHGTSGSVASPAANVAYSTSSHGGHGEQQTSGAGLLDASTGWPQQQQQAHPVFQAFAGDSASSSAGSHGLPDLAPTSPTGAPSQGQAYPVSSQQQQQQLDARSTAGESATKRHRGERADKAN
ncbi:hypothetical protein V8E36_004287 [Tilletia maclaganii]